MAPDVKPNVAMGFYFFPRGGSAQVVRYLSKALQDGPWSPQLFAGSIGTSAAMSNAEGFFAGLRCASLNYSAAWSDWERGADPFSSIIPMHGSYEDKADVPDRIFFELDNDAFARQVASWTAFFGTHAHLQPRVVHLHHLTPMHEAARAVWPDVPVITHLHGTELKMLEAAIDPSPANKPGRWTRQWVGRMRRWAAESDRVVVVSPQDEVLARRLLPVDVDRMATISSGVDTDIFGSRPQHSAERRWRWKRWLVDDPRGWRPGLAEGSIRYSLDDLSSFTNQFGSPVPVVLFAGRFMKFKRLQLLIEAHHALRTTTSFRSVLVIAGGFPGEWEGEHPYDTVQRLGAEGVFFLGWRDHDHLAEMLHCADVFAAPAVDEPFGLVYLEAMAAGLPPIATNTGGPRSFINVDQERPTGWLVPPDDLAATTQALAEAVADRAMRIQRGTRAAEFVRNNYSWSSAANSFAALYAETVEEHDRLKPTQPGRPTSGVA
jgi:glycosyltransferase involved in cell wall biosynthesis